MLFARALYKRSGPSGKYAATENIGETPTLRGTIAKAKRRLRELRLRSDLSCIKVQVWDPSVDSERPVWESCED